MSKLGDEIKNASAEQREVILAHVSHIDLKKEFCYLVDEGKKVDAVVAEVKKVTKKKATKKAVKKPDVEEEEK